MELAFSWRRWLNRLNGLGSESRGRQRRQRRRPTMARLSLESLEERTLLSAQPVMVGLLDLPPPQAPAIGNSPLPADSMAESGFLNLTAPLGNFALPAIPGIPPAAEPDTQHLTAFSQPVKKSDGYGDDERESADVPVQVTGAFLTDRPVSQITAANGTRYSFTDVAQLYSETCVFASALAAVARSGFDLSSNIIVKNATGPNTGTFSVRLYSLDSSGNYKPVWVDVFFDGKIYPTDLQSTDPNEFWPTIYQRAYLKLAQETGTDVTNMGKAFGALTGLPYTYYDLRPGGLLGGINKTLLPFNIQGDLASGHPVIAATRNASSFFLNESGLISNHAYTVLGIDITPSGTFVTLRNPWGTDTSRTYFDANHDGRLSIDEVAVLRGGLDGRNDGIIRIPWSTFTAEFDSVVKSQYRGNSTNTPQVLAPPRFKQANLGTQTIAAGDTLTLDLSATTPSGKPISYYLDTSDSFYGGNPGKVDLRTGKYTWDVPAGQTTGTYLVTVVAQVSPVDTASLTFKVNVVNPQPSIGSFLSDRDAISMADGRIILTARNVTGIDAHDGKVVFYRDSNHNGKLDKSSDEILAILPYSSSGTYLWSGSVRNLTAGVNETFFVEARYELDGRIYSSSVNVTAPVIAGQSLPPLVAPVGVETRVPSVQASYPLVAYDDLGNTVVFWSDLRANNQVWMRRFDPSGTSLGEPVSLDLVQGYLADVSMLSDGRFVILWTSLDGQLRAKQFQADGSPMRLYGNYDVINSGSEVLGARISASTERYYSVVLTTTASLKLVQFSGGYVTGTQSLALSSAKGLPEGAIARDANGAMLVAWINPASGHVLAQRFDSDSNPIGSVVTVDRLIGVGKAKTAGRGNVGVALDEQGRSVITWVEENNAGTVLLARRFLADMTPVDAQPFRVNDSMGGSIQSDVEIDFRANRFVITWVNSDSTSTGNNVLAQAYSWDNTLRRLGGNFDVPTSKNNLRFSKVALDPTGANFVIAWRGLSGTDVGVYFKRYTGLDTASAGFDLQGLPPQTGSLLTIPRNPEAGELLGLFTNPLPGKWSYTLVAGSGDTDNNSFEIANGFLSMTSKGVAAGPQSHYSIRVKATPDYGVAVEQVFSLSGAELGPINLGQLDTSRSYAYAAAIQGNGKIVVVGKTSGISDTPFLIRYNPDGALDPSFAGAGKILVPLNGASGAANGVVVQPDAKILIVGTIDNETARSVFLARYNPDGSLDKEFGKDGLLITPFSRPQGSLDARLAVDAEGKLLIAARDATPSGPNNIGVLKLARYKPDGTLDNSFGTNGIATLALEHGVTPRALSIMPDGRIVVAAESTDSSDSIQKIVARFLPNGSLDRSFNGIGYERLASLASSERINAVVVMPDGKIRVGGTFGIYGLNADGSTDTTWGGTGLVMTSVLSSDVLPVYALTLQPDGKILAAGPASDGTGSDFAFLRYTATGTVDMQALQDFGGMDSPQSIALSADAQCVMVGYTGADTTGRQDVVIWQYDLNGPPAARIQGNTAAVAGQPVALTLGAVSPSLLDQVAGFIYEVDWGDKSGRESFQGLNGLSVSHVFTSPGSYQIQVSAIDQQGNKSAPASWTMTIRSAPSSPSQPPAASPASPQSPAAPPAASQPPQLHKPLLLALFDSMLAGTVTVNDDGTMTLVDSLFGFPLLISVFDAAGNLKSVTMFGMDVTALFKLF